MCIRDRPRGKRPCLAAANVMAGSVTRVGIFAFTSSTLCVCAVSYTHLDVYKRQVLGRANLSKKFGQRIIKLVKQM